MGMPEIVPVLGSSLRPDGNEVPAPPTENVYGGTPPMATNLSDNGRFARIWPGKEFMSESPAGVTVMAKGWEAVSGGENESCAASTNWKVPI